MIVDSSAVVAIFIQEPGYQDILRKLTRSSEIGIGAPTLVECGIVLSARLGVDARGMLARFLEETNISIIPFTDKHFGVAMRAWLQYGKGRHPASLNYGDCMAYAVANMAAIPLLCVGNDFTQTDLTLA